MANTKISALPPASTLLGPEIIPAVQSGADVGATATQLQVFAQQGVQPYWPAPVSTNWYFPYPGLSVAAGGVLPNGQICLLPFILEQPMTIKGLGVRVTTASASGSFGLAIYASTPIAGVGHRPTGPALVGSTAMSPVTATNVPSNALGPLTLQPSTLYWAAAWADSAAGGVMILQAANVASVWMASLVGAATQAHIDSASTAAALFLTYASAWTTGAPANPPWPTITSTSCVEVAPGNAAASTYGLVQLLAN